MATVLTKKLLQETIETIQQVYMEDNIPWICGYSLSLIHISEPTRPY